MSDPHAPPGEISKKTLRSIAESSAESRIDWWQRFIEISGVRHMAEIGVFRGGFAASVLKRCDGIVRYYMIDPWRNLGDWNKPANVPDDEFAHVFAEAMEKTAPWAGKRVVLRGRTSEVIDRIPDDALDFAYVDGDHTLRGITIDLIRCYPKVRAGGWIGGDDFSASIWQHPSPYEPTLVFPLAVYFAEAVDDRIYALPHSQFLIEKRSDRGFEFHDLTGHYSELGLRGQLVVPGEHLPIGESWESERDGASSHAHDPRPNPQPW